VATVAVDLVWAVGIGLLTAGTLALRSVARQARLEPTDLIDATPEGERIAAAERTLLERHVVAYRVDGPLFFAAAHRFLVELPALVDVEVVILRLSRVTTIDASGALALRDAIADLERRGIVVYLSGIREGDHRALRALDVTTRLTAAGRAFPTTPDAIVAARRHLADTRC
jgi:SulP family sulfate permease